MAATLTPLLLSGSTNGLPIAIGASSSPGTIIHTAVAGTTSFDLILLYVVNLGSADVITIQWGNTGGGTFNICDQYAVDSHQKPELIAPWFQLQNGLIVRAFSGGVGAFSIMGRVLRSAP